MRLAFVDFKKCFYETYPRVIFSHLFFRALAGRMGRVGRGELRKSIPKSTKHNLSQESSLVFKNKDNIVRVSWQKRPHTFNIFSDRSTAVGVK